MWQDYSGYYLLLVPFRVKTQTRAERNPLFFICAATRNWRRICTIRKQRKRDSWDVTICNKPKRILRSNVQSKQKWDKTFTLIRSKNQNFLQFLLLLDCLLLVSLTLFHWSRSFLSPLFPNPSENGSSSPCESTHSDLAPNFYFHFSPITQVSFFSPIVFVWFKFVSLEFSFVFLVCRLSLL